METSEIKKIVEALLFVSDQPLNENVIKFVLGELAKDQNIVELVKSVSDDYANNGSPIELREVAGGWQFATKKEYAPFIRRLYKDKTTVKLSNSALETLAVIAYKQPITRSEIEEIRGVETSGVVDTLLERKLIRIVGRKETLGRPLLYGTTHDFLKHFGLSHLSELPSLEELTPPEEAAPEVADGTPELPFNEAEAAAQEEGASEAVAEVIPEGENGEVVPMNGEGSAEEAVPAPEAADDTAAEGNEPAEAPVEPAQGEELPAAEEPAAEAAVEFPGAGAAPVEEPAPVESSGAIEEPVDVEEQAALPEDPDPSSQQ